MGYDFPFNSLMPPNLLSLIIYDIKTWFTVLFSSELFVSFCLRGNSWKMNIRAFPIWLPCQIRQALHNKEKFFHFWSQNLACSVTVSDTHHYTTEDDLCCVIQNSPSIYVIRRGKTCIDSVFNYPPNFLLRKNSI